jgi:hypothetical protein
VFRFQSKVDVAVEVAPKEPNPEKAGAKNERRARDWNGSVTASAGVPGPAVCWHLEVLPT